MEFEELILHSARTCLVRTLLKFCCCFCETAESMNTPPTKVRFNEDDDLLLCIQANADLPFCASHGRVLKAWDGVARKLSLIDSFRPKHVDGKAVQARFNKLIDRHRQFQSDAKKKSGSAEEETDIVQALDDLISAIDDHHDKLKEMQEHKNKQEAEKKVYCPYSLYANTNFSQNR